VRALIIQEFKSLEVKHGTELVRAALSFITLTKDGVSETELSEILSLDDDVLASVYEWWVVPRDARGGQWRRGADDALVPPPVLGSSRLLLS
jgi:hypothetical protein